MAEPVRVTLYKDEPRYINYALSLVEHRTFGISHDYKTNVIEPGAANTPAYPGLLAAATFISEDLHATLLCVQSDPALQTNCPEHYGTILVVQYALAVLTLVLVWVIAINTHIQHHTSPD